MLADRRVLDDAPVVQHHHPLAQKPDKTQFMGDEDHRHAVARPHGADKVNDLALQQDVKVRSSSRGAWAGGIGGGDFEMTLMSRIGLSATD